MTSRMFDNLRTIVSNTLTDDIKMIDVKQLHASEDNFFSITRIEEFADTIQGQGGIKDNLLVKPLDTGGYEVISGHRRLAAIKYLIEKGENVSRLLPCLVQNYSDDDSKKLDIILMNVSSRQLSDSELMKSYEVVDEILKRRKDKGEKFGKVRSKLAEILGVSQTQIARLKNIKDNAIPEVRHALDDGLLSVCTASEIAGLSTDAQEDIVSNNSLSDIRHKDIVQRKGVQLDTKSVQDYAEEKNFNTSDDIVQKKGVQLDTKSVQDYAEIKNFNTSDDTAQKKGVQLDTKSLQSYMEIKEFITNHYTDIDEIFNEYIGMTSNIEKIELVEKFDSLISSIREKDRKEQPT